MNALRNARPAALATVPLPNPSTSGRSSSAGRLLAFLLALTAAALFTVDLWPADKPVTPASTAALSATSARTPSTPGASDHSSHTAAVADTADARGSLEGYDASVHLIPTGVGTDHRIVLEVDLSVEATPASAPTASAQLRGPNGRLQAITLTITGAGRWRSHVLTIPAGRYTLSTRFDRQGHPLTIPIAITVA